MVSYMIDDLGDQVERGYALEEENERQRHTIERLRNVAKCARHSSKIITGKNAEIKRQRHTIGRLVAALSSAKGWILKQRYSDVSDHQWDETFQLLRDIGFALNEANAIEEANHAV